MGKRILRRLVIASLVGASAFMAAAPSSKVAAAAGTTTQYAPASLGQAARITGSTTAGTASTATRSRGARRVPVHGSGSAGLRAPAARTASTTASTLLHNFNGVSSLDSAVTNYGAQFEPPDQGLCAGNGFILEPVNSAYRVYRPDGTSVVGPFNVNDIFNVGGEEFTSDPRCYYDHATDTWFVIILFINDRFNASSVDIAVSRTGDPTKLWNEYRIDTTDNGAKGEPKNPGCPCLGDQPTLGIDKDNLYFTTNEFSLLGPQFNGAQVYAVAKSDLVAGVNRAHFVHFGHLHIGGTVAASVQPALTAGTPNAEFFMNSLDPNGTFDNRLGVWAMTNTAAVASGQSPTLSSLVITSEAYGRPPSAAQKGSSSVLDSGDDRMQQTQFTHDTLWGELTTAVTVPGDSTERAGAAWFAVHPSLAGSVLGSATISQQGYEAAAGEYVLYPAVQVDAAGRAAMVFTLTGKALYPSAAYAVMQPGATDFGAPVIAAAGSGHYDRNAGRWGDYSWAVLAPDGSGFWMATEYVPPKDSQTTNGQRNWGTRVFEVCSC